jgi:hypothetical protein
MTVDAISVRGVMQMRDQFVAMIQGADNRTYIVHEGDLLADGVVARVIPQGLILVQHTADPLSADNLSAEKPREVRKLLRSFKEAKELP